MKWCVFYIVFVLKRNVNSQSQVISLRSTYKPVSGSQKNKTNLETVPSVLVAFFLL